MKSKILQTELGLDYYNSYNLNCVIGRPFNIFSYDLPESLSLGSFIAQIDRIKECGTIKVGNLNTKRDFLFVEDAVSALWKILTNGVPGEIYNICSGNSIFMHDFLDHLIKHSGKNITVEIDPERYRKVDVFDSFGDNIKLTSTLGWTFRKIEISH